MDIIKKPELINIFKEEYRLDNDDSLKESREMMRLRPDVRAKMAQRLRDQEEFDRLYRKWKEETMILSNISQIYENDNYLAIIRMGRRAVPFIYEKAKMENVLLYDVLEKVYGCRLERNAKKVTAKQFLDSWLKKIEEEGDV